MQVTPASVHVTHASDLHSMDNGPGGILLDREKEYMRQTYIFYGLMGADPIYIFYGLLEADPYV